MISKSLQNEFPQPFPPSWADSWGEDEYGLYADLNVSSHFQSLSNLISDARGLFQGHKKKKGENLKVIIQRFRWIAAGDFLMGSPKDELQRSDREDQHKVTLTQGYWLADTSVTIELWKLVMDTNPVSFTRNILNPVEKVSWNDSKEFIDKLNDINLDALDGLVIRLPTEAEWEHACRASSTTPFSFGENITAEQVNFNGSFPYNNGKKSKDRSKIVAVKSLPPNAWGLYEMHGNVWEWCADAWQESLGTQPIEDPCTSYESGAYRVMRGGSWFSNGRDVRSAYRRHRSPDDRDRHIGLRICLGHELETRGSK